ncbi:hypothetical protein GCM10020000_43670 [Streptomyces olivoverticillatus]
MPSRNILYEAMRLLPPSWNLLRNRSPEYPVIDDRIRPGDDLLMLPLLTHRDPALWDAPDAFRPERWDTLDPDDTPGYMPFGHASERCWGGGTWSCRSPNSSWTTYAAPAWSSPPGSARPRCPSSGSSA